MNIIQYKPSLKVVNLDHLPRGTGARYLEVMRAHNGDLVAVGWRHSQKGIPSGHDLIDFKRRQP